MASTRFSEEVALIEEEQSEDGNPPSLAQQIPVPPISSNLASASLRYRIFVFAVGLVGLGIILFACFSPRFVKNNRHERIVFSKTSRQLQIFRTETTTDPALLISMAGTLDPKFTIHGPYDDVQNSSKGFRYLWKDDGELVANLTIDEKNSTCVLVSWRVIPSAKEFCTMFEDCIALGAGHWYGGGEIFNQTWPVEKGSMPMTPYVTQDASNSSKPVFGSILDPVWFSSDGTIVVVDEETPLHVSWSRSLDPRGTGAKLCLRGAKNEDYYPRVKASQVVLKYTVCLQKNARRAFEFLLNTTYFAKPKKIPSLPMIRWPSWSTRVAFHGTVLNQAALEQFVEDIISNGFVNTSRFVIDNEYSDHAGNLTFNRQWFPTPADMVMYLKNKSRSDVIVRVTPFTSVKTDAFQIGVAKGFFVRGSNNHVNLVTWMNSDGGVVDMTSDKARTWFYDNLMKMMDYGVDSFKFDAGEVQYLPLHHTFSSSLANPSMYSSLYAWFASEKFGPQQETRVAYRTQALGRFVTIATKHSRWDQINGLSSLLSAALTISILGYPFILPDMIGGSDRELFGEHQEELFIRWVQLSAFMPAMQFSLPPWKSVDRSVLAHSLQAVKLHKHLADSIILPLANQTTITGYPILRPLWWIAPSLAEAQTSRNQFLVGDDVMVAAVLAPKVSKLDVFLPPGCWHYCNGTRYSSGVRGLMVHVQVFPQFIPYFCRISGEGCQASTLTNTTICHSMPCYQK